jgi:hypothetical protein
MQDADEVIIGVRLQGPTQAGEVVVVVRGVHADIDPAKLVDADGRALWTSGPYAGARELLRAPDSGTGESIDASLFELPGRTWVIATGEARERARAAFAHPTGRPSPELDPTPLAIVRMDGPSLIARVQAMHAVAAILGLARGLRTVTFALPPGTAANVRATLAYDDDDSAALAEATAREVIEAIARKKPERLAWLGAARVDRSPKDARQVVVSAPLPAELVGALLHAGSAAFEPPTGSP